MVLKLKILSPRRGRCCPSTYRFTGTVRRFIAGDTFRSVSPVRRSISKQRGPAWVACLIISLICSGCIRQQLHRFEKHAADGDHEWIAAQRIDCQEVSDGCSRLHLISGDACFRLAEAGKKPAVNYAIAAHELEKGLALRPSWENTAVQLQIQENLCESLKSWLDLQSGETAGQPLDRFVEAAKALYQLAPETVPAVYYLANARLRQVQPMLRDINVATPVPVCIRLKRTLTRVLSMMETTNASPLPDWDRFADNYRRLSFDLGVAIGAGGCR